MLWCWNIVNKNILKFWKKDSIVDVVVLKNKLMMFIVVGYGFKIVLVVGKFLIELVLNKLLFYDMIKFRI